jgi:hypothetical protein
VVEPGLELAGEELRHALVEVEHGACAQKAGAGGHVHQEVGDRVGLDHVVATTQVEAGHQQARDREEHEVLDQLQHLMAAPLARKGQSVDAEALGPLAERLTLTPQAHDVHVVPGVPQCLDLAVHPRVEGHEVLTDDADAHVRSP